MQNGLGNLIESIKLLFFANMKETSTWNNFLMLLFITIATFILNNDMCYNKFENLLKNFLDSDYLSFLSSKKNSIILEGKRCVKISSYMTKTDNLFSNRFSAFWYYISKNSLDNPTIKSLREYANSQNIYDGYGDPINSKHHKKNYDDNDLENEFRNTDIFIIEQTRSFKISNDIYCKVSKSINKLDEKTKYEMENITIELYSFTFSLEYLKDFIDNLYQEYRKELNRLRNNKKFIYTLLGSSNNHDNEVECAWEECEFKSARTFNNLFFDNKKSLLNKLNFFINNRDWYDREGHPYTFGIGLHGPPGTGKTSIIKSIANKLNRHIIVIPLNKIKTQKEFSKYFFEKYYNINNNKIDFENKIIVFEDIDCMTDIVKKREIKNNINNNDIVNIDENIEQKNLNNTITQNKLLNKIAKKIDEDHEDTLIVDINKTNNDKITLSYILNIIDGIRETPGRILIITSNDYESLDPALIRPGRIDMTLEMKNASIDTIKEMFNHYYNDFIPDDVEKHLKDYVVSPAKIVNLRLENERKEDFLSNLLKEFKKLKDKDYFNISF